MGVVIERVSSLVGRESEAATLRTATDVAIGGRARSVLIAGEPGIGKTALAEDAAAYAEKAGALVLWGGCWGGEGAPAYWPWIQIVRTYVNDRPTGELLADMGDGAADIARLVPEVGGRFLSITPEGDTDPEQARFRLFDHLSRFLRAAAEAQPLCLVFDDLHWADRSSLIMLRFFAQAAREARILVVGTYRDVELATEDRGTLADLNADRIVLHGLAPNEVAALIQMTIGTQPAPELAAAVFGRTTGNPFFVKEVARLLDVQGRFDPHGRAATYAIPEGVRDVVRRRLAHLSQETVATLGAASVFGPDFGIDLLGRLIKTERDEVLAPLEEAVDARLVGEVPDSVGGYSFAHALVREVLYEDLGAARRSALHWRAGELLEQKHGEAHLTEIAHHLVKGAAQGDPAKAADAALRAARLSVRMYAWDQAAELYGRSLDALAIAGSDDARRVRTMLELGDAHVRAGNLAAARRVFEKAAELASGLGLRAELAHAALGLGGGLGGFEVRLFDDRQLDLLGRALEQLPTEDSAIRAWLLARLSVASSFVRPAEERAGMSREAVAMAERLGDRGALSYALSSLCDALAGPDNVADRVAAATQMIDLAAQPAAGAARCGVESCAVCLCDPEFALLGRRFRVVANLEAGDIAAVDRDIESYGRLAEHLRQPLYLWYAPFFRGMRAMLGGELDDAQACIDDATAIAAGTSSGNAAILTETQRLGLALEAGDTLTAERAWRSLDAASSELEKLPSASGRRAVMSGMFGDASAAVPMLRRWVAAGGLNSLPKDSEWLSTAAYTAESALRAEDTASADHVYGALAPYENLFVVDGIAARFMGSVAHYLGRLATLLQRYEEAERHLRTAIAAHDATGAVLWGARSRNELERARSGAGREPDGEAAPSLPGGNIFRREGEYWTVAFNGAVARLKHSKGLRDIALLLASSGREVAALDLVARDVGAPAPRMADAGEIIDERARAAYKRRIAELQSEIDDDEDPTRAARAREELDALAAQLAGAYGLGGRARKAGDPAERARKAVTERIRDAVAKLAREHPALHRHLKVSIRTGTFCSYTPERPMTWDL